MSDCTLDENVAPGTCPRCDAELKALRAVVEKAQRVADNFDDWAVGLTPVEQALVDALDTLRGVRGE